MDTAGMDADGLAAAVTKQGSLVRQMKKVHSIRGGCVGTTRDRDISSREAPKNI